MTDVQEKRPLTVTRAITEVKTLLGRLNEIDTDSLVRVVTRDVKCPESDATLNSLKDMYNRVIQLKRAISRSNSGTMITVCGERMTVAEAISLRSLYLSLDDIFPTINNRINMGRHVAVENNARLRKEILGALKVDEFGDNSTAIREIVESQVRDNEKVLYGEKQLQWCINSGDKVKDFLMEVDYALSESNAITTINLSF